MAKRKDSLTRRYAKTLWQVYKNEGLLSAIDYELKSTGYSLGKRVANFFDPYPARLHTDIPKEVEDISRYNSKVYPLQVRDWEGRQRERKERKSSYILRKEKSLGSKVSGVVALVGLVGGVFFLSPNLTGNAIINTNQTTSNWTGGVLLLMGLVGFYISCKCKKK